MHMLTLLILTFSSAWAGSNTLLPWTELGLSEASVDAQARGPGLLDVGPTGRLLLYDSVRREVVLLEDDHPAVAFPVRHASDLLLLDRGILVLDHAARELSLWSLDGQQRAVHGLPPLVPTAVTLRLEGDQVLALDPFGHGHPVATIGDGELRPPVAKGLQERSPAVRWDGSMMFTAGLDLSLPHAIKASGQRFGDWLVVDEVVADSPIEVTRTAWHVPSRQAHPLPVQGRLYAPSGDLAATPEGELVVLVPRAEGLEILRVSP